MLAEFLRFHASHEVPCGPRTDLRRAATFLIDTNIIRGDTLTRPELARRGDPVLLVEPSPQHARHGSPRAVHARVVARRQHASTSPSTTATRCAESTKSTNKRGPVASPKINTFREIVPLIYSWRTPDVPKYSGWEKIGYTEQDSADTRIAQQASQMSITKEKVWSRRALYTTEAGGRFTDKDFHAFLKQQGVERETTPKRTEWHHFAVAPRRRRSSTSTTSRAKTSTNFRPVVKTTTSSTRAAGGRRAGTRGLRGRVGRGALEREAPVRQDSDDVRPDAGAGRQEGPHRHQPSRDRQLLVRRLHALHRPPDDLQVRLGVPFTRRAVANVSRTVAPLRRRPRGPRPTHHRVRLPPGSERVAVLRRQLPQAEAHRRLPVGPPRDRRGSRGCRHDEDRRRLQPDQAHADPAPVGHAL